MPNERESNNKFNIPFFCRYRNLSRRQAKLEPITKSRDFKTILESEARERNLALDDVRRCIGTIYNEASMYCHGSAEPIG